MSETIQRTKLYEDVTERMLDHIRTETWAPGTKIPPEVELAKLFDVSRCTIREAVKSLQIAGFLRSRAGSGTFVSERAPTLLQTQALAGIMADPAALRELVQARYILEPQLAQMAAQAATEEEIRGLFAILDRMKRGQTRFELMSVGHQFHLSLAQLAHNRVLYGFYVSAASQMRSMRVLESLTLEVYRGEFPFDPTHGTATARWPPSACASTCRTTTVPTSPSSPRRSPEKQKTPAAAFQTLRRGMFFAAAAQSGRLR